MNRSILSEEDGDTSGALLGFSAAALNAPGENLDFLKGGFGFHDAGRSFGVRMLSMDDGLLLCRRPSDTEAGETEIPYPWFQPLDPKCLGGSRPGVRLDQRLVLSVDVAPMFFFVKSQWSDTHVNSFLRLHYLRRAVHRQLVLDLNAWIGGNTRSSACRTQSLPRDRSTSPTRRFRTSPERILQSRGKQAATRRSGLLCSMPGWP